MYDVLRGRYTFACPAREHASVPLSAFRQVERLPGAAHPAVYHVRFACVCGDEHDGLVAHDDLDWAPLGVGEERGFVNLMTDRLEPIQTELRDLAARWIRSGRWPWAIFCYPEGRPRPAFPSLFHVLAPRGSGAQVGLVARCSSCGKLSVNVVSTAHVDVPFHHDAEVGVLERVLSDDVLVTFEDVRAELWSASYDARRLSL
jgi:hypothetical protein